MNSEMHVCPVDGCGKLVHNSVLMCRMHWGMVPSSVKRKVWNAIDLRKENPDSREYLLRHTLACRGAVSAVNMKLAGERVPDARSIQIRLVQK